MIIYWVWRFNINIPLAGVASAAPPSKYYLCAWVISEQRWRKMKGGSGIGEHTQVWSMMEILGGGGAILCTCTALYIEAGV